MQLRAAPVSRPPGFYSQAASAARIVLSLLIHKNFKTNKPDSHCIVLSHSELCDLPEALGHL